MKTALVVTTIQSPNAVMRDLAAAAQASAAEFFVIGDRKTPEPYVLPSAQYLSLEEQQRRFPEFGKALPVGHYVRKNLGYLLALESGADWIVETDDDNYPLAGFMQPPPASIRARTLDTNAPRWVNAYHYFEPSHDIWPRGLPLEFLAEQSRLPPAQGTRECEARIVQGLANDNPDVDAVYRLTRPLPVNFGAQCEPLALLAGQWCPFNSQNTWFSRAAAPLLYLPAHCSFRMTDIWRSYVAQRCLWASGHNLIFVKATVRQERNEHNLLRDFSDEVSGYLQNEKISRCLDEIELGPDYSESLLKCYRTLVQADIFPKAELSLIEAWLHELAHLPSA